jgi:23S rRNA (adenine2030-N6)-methyltransferase
MLSYQHIYHAGNFADVHKHALLVKILSALTARNPRLCIVDTHAGRGLYDFTAEEAQKKQEFRNGIAALDGAEGGPVADYLTLARKYGADKYPGSAVIARDLLRPSDRLICAEMHPGEFEFLKESLKDAANAEVHKTNGFQLMADTMPPPERKGLVVIDPPYEIRSDYIETPRRVHQAWKTWPQGAFFIWYPILTDDRHLILLTELRKSAMREILVSEVRLGKMPAEGFSMHGSGVALVNPPLPEATIEEATRHIAGLLHGTGETFWLANRAISPETGLIAV